MFNNNVLNEIQIFNICERTPLHLSVENGDVEIVKLLLSRKDIDINAEDEILLKIWSSYPIF